MHSAITRRQALYHPVEDYLFWLLYDDETATMMLVTVMKRNLTTLGLKPCLRYFLLYACLCIIYSEGVADSNSKINSQLLKKFQLYKIPMDTPQKSRNSNFLVPSLTRAGGLEDCKKRYINV